MSKNQEETGSHIESLMEDMGMTDHVEADTEGGNEEVEQPTDENQEDLSVSDETTDNKTDENTESNPQLDSLKNQIEGMEKRLKDKDDYIQTLKETKSDNKTDENDDTDTEEEGFWDNPEETIKSMQQKIDMQNVALQEAIYANSVKDYYEVVNPDAVQEAVASDSEFAKKLTSEAEPHKVAYAYLKTKNDEKAALADSEREKIRQEVIAEMEGKAPKAPANINNVGSSSRTENAEVEDDGFASVFG